MNKYARFILAAGLALPAPVLAQDALEGFMADLPFAQAGVIAGMPVYSLPETDLIWFRDPATGTVIAGYAFDADGNDVGSDLIGMPAISVYDSFSEQFATIGTQEADVATDAPAIAAVPDESAEAPVMPASDLEAIANEALLAASVVLENVPEADKRDYLLDLIARIDRADSPQAFQQSLLEWNAMVTGQELPQPAESLSAIDIDAVERGLVEEPASPEAVAAPADGRNAEKQALMDTIIQDGAWFEVGSAGSPVIYAIIDPTCPHCASAIRDLAPRIEAGELHLRVLLAPLVSERSPDVIAGILMAADPVQAFLEHEILYAERGASNLDVTSFGDLDRDLQLAVQTNMNLVIDNQLPGVPFFAWQTETGPEFLAGAPEAGAFAAALPASTAPAAN